MSASVVEWLASLFYSSLELSRAGISRSVKVIQRQTTCSDSPRLEQVGSLTVQVSQIPRTRANVAQLVAADDLRLPDAAGGDEGGPHRLGRAHAERVHRQVIGGPRVDGIHTCNKEMFSKET